MTTPNTSAAPPRAEPPPEPAPRRLNPWWVASRGLDAAGCAFLAMALCAFIVGVCSFALPYVSAAVVVCVQSDFTLRDPCADAALTALIGGIVFVFTFCWAVGQVARTIEANGKEKYVTPRRRP